MVRIGERRVGGAAPCLVVAEAGLNHDGDVGTALELVDAAAEAGADVVKFQSLTAAGLCHPDHPAFGLLRSLELDRAAFERIAVRAAEGGIGFASTPFDESWVGLLAGLGVAFLKVASPDIVTTPLLEAVGAAGKPVVVSTGMATLDEITEALATLRRAGAGEVVLLHCVSAYPTPPEAANLRAIRTLEDRFGLPVGFSDHTVGIEAPVWAAAAGAAMIEKHFTLDTRRKGPDHALSLDPAGFRRMVDEIRRLERSLGTGEKACRSEERSVLHAARRGLILTRAVRAGETIRREDLRAVRPLAEDGGVPANRIGEIAGRSAARDLPMGHLLRWKDGE
jgi:sialic acid synthase SpsE